MLVFIVSGMIYILLDFVFIFMVALHPGPHGLVAADRPCSKIKFSLCSIAY